MSDTAIFTLDRRFDAPVDLVWKAWTDETYQSRWYGPGVTTVIHENRLEPGGQWLVEMKGEGWSARQRADYLTVEPPHRLEFIQGMADADWSFIRNPLAPDWPRLMRAHVEFTEAGDKTQMRFVWEPYDASEAERGFFAQALDDMSQGWDKGLAILENLLAEMQV